MVMCPHCGFKPRGPVPSVPNEDLCPICGELLKEVKG